MNEAAAVVDANIAFTLYVALTLHLDDRLWTDDAVLKAGLQAKGFDRFFSMP